MLVKVVLAISRGASSKMFLPDFRQIMNVSKHGLDCVFMAGTVSDLFIGEALTSSLSVSVEHSYILYHHFSQLMRKAITKIY